MTTYRCDDYRPITNAESAHEAAKAFADRAARRKFGSRGYCHHVRLDNAAGDGRYANYQAFIGLPTYGGGMSGHNINLTVYAEPPKTAGSVAAWK